MNAFEQWVKDKALVEKILCSDAYTQDWEEFDRRLDNLEKAMRVVAGLLKDLKQKVDLGEPRDVEKKLMEMRRSLWR